MPTNKMVDGRRPLDTALSSTEPSNLEESVPWITI